jgi:two-component system sensor histidine kinase HydH
MSSPEAIKVMATWVAAIADNIKNPVAGITAVLDLLETQLHDPHLLGSKVEQIRQRLAELNEYVSELAEFAQPATISPTRASLRPLIVQASQAITLPAGCEVVIDVPPALSANIDQKKFVLMIKSLLRNGLEAVHSAQTPRLIVSGRMLASGSTAISVEDNGPGIDPNQVARALEPFFSTKEAGTGLGLAVVRKYVEAHGGGISVDRSPQLGGCRINLSLPR